MAPGGKEELVADHGAVHNHVLRWADVGFGVTDLHGKLSWANPALGTLIGVPSDQALGRSLPALVPGAPESPQPGLVVQAAGPADGEHRWLEISCTPLPGTLSDPTTIAEAGSVWTAGCRRSPSLPLSMVARLPVSIGRQSPSQRP